MPQSTHFLSYKGIVLIHSNKLAAFVTFIFYKLLI